MAKCPACGKFLSSSGAISCGTCNSIYHRGCVGIADSAKLSEKWGCPECKKKLKRGDNSNTPVKPICESHEQEIHPSVASTLPPRVDALIDRTDGANVGADVQGLRRELAECMAVIRDFRLEMTEFRVSIASITTRLNGFEQRLEAVEKSQVQPVSEDVAKLEHTVTQLKMELNDRDQEALQSDIEIGHLPEEKGENIMHTITVLASRMGVSLEERDVVFAERVGVTQGAVAAGEIPRGRRVIVRLARRHLRDEILQAARVRRTLTITDSGRNVTGGTSPSQGRIFINERLTRENRLLFYRAREECRKLLWRFSWTKRGRIYVRQAEGKPAHNIRSEADLARVFGAAVV